MGGEKEELEKYYLDCNPLALIRLMSHCAWYVFSALPKGSHSGDSGKPLGTACADRAITVMPLHPIDPVSVMAKPIYSELHKRLPSIH